MSIHIVDGVNTYKVHGTCPARGGTDNGPGGDSDGSANRRPVANVISPTGCRQTARGLQGVTGLKRQVATCARGNSPAIKAAGTTRYCDDARRPHSALTPYIHCDKAGGYEVPGDGGRGRNVDGWM